MDADLDKQWMTVDFSPNTSVATALHVRTACSHIQNAPPLALPLLEPWKCVESFGVSRALSEDLRHYTPEFTLAMGGVLVDFAADVLARREGSARGGAATPPGPAPATLIVCRWGRYTTRRAHNHNCGAICPNFGHASRCSPASLRA